MVLTGQLSQLETAVDLHRIYFNCITEHNVQLNLSEYQYAFLFYYNTIGIQNLFHAKAYGNNPAIYDIEKKIFKIIFHTDPKYYSVVNGEVEETKSDDTSKISEAQIVIGGEAKAITENDLIAAGFIVAFTVITAGEALVFYEGVCEFGWSGAALLYSYGLLPQTLATVNESSEVQDDEVDIISKYTAKLDIIKTKDDANQIINEMETELNKAAEAEVEAKIIDTLEKEPESIFEYVTETTDEGDYINCKTVDGEETYLDKSKLTKDQIKCLEDGCFTGETLVETFGGLRRIDSLNVGDLVLSEDPKTGVETYKKVLTVYKKTTNELYTLNVNGENITTTSGHLFMMSNRLWKSAKNIKAGDKIIDASGKLEQVNNIEIKRSENYTRIYNLKVEDYHTYFVSSLLLLVHNKCGVNLDELASETGKSYSTLINENLGETVYIKGKRISLPSAPHNNGTLGHWDTMVNKTIELTDNSDVEEIWLNKGLSNVKEIDKIDPNRRPDIIVKRTDGKIDQYEVPSKTDDINALRARMEDNKRILGDLAGEAEILPIP